MNIGTGVVQIRHSEALQPSRYTVSQLNLPLGVDPRADDGIRAAWARSRLPIPYHVALQNRALSICLSCLADAMRRRKADLQR
jgi:hypothetical protein